MNLLIALNVEKFLTGHGTVSFLRRMFLHRVVVDDSVVEELIKFTKYLSHDS